MDALCRSAGILGGSPSAMPRAPAGAGRALTSSKPLAFSIERIMARETPEPARSIPFLPHLFAAHAGKADGKQPQPHATPTAAALHCVLPFVPLAYDAGHKLASLAGGLDHHAGPFEGSAARHAADFLQGVGLNYKHEQQPPELELGAGQYKLFRPRVVHQSSFHALGGTAATTACYLSHCGEPPAGPPPAAPAALPAALVNLHHPMASYFFHAPPLHHHARHKALLLAEKGKAERHAAGDPGFKELQLHHRAHHLLLSDKVLKGAAAAKLGGGSCANGGGKSKVFTCEICGKVRAPPPARAHTHI